MTLLLAALLAAQDIGFDPRPGAPIPPDLALRDERGEPVRLGDGLASRPAILAFVYFRCPALCSETLASLRRTLRAVTFRPGADFTVFVVSFDPDEDVRAAPRPEKGWRYLTGSGASIGALTSAAGFRYSRGTRSGEFAHAAGIVILTPEGRISRAFPGLEYPPRDVRLALVEASQGRIGTAADRLVLLCLRYDPASGRYSLAILSILRAGGAATFLVVAGFLARSWWRHRRPRK